jgi:transposase
MGIRRIFAFGSMEKSSAGVRVEQRRGGSVSARARGYGWRSGWRRPVRWSRRDKAVRPAAVSWRLMPLVIGWVEARGDITMPELAAKLKAARGVTVHPASLSRFLIARGFSVKKNIAGDRDRSR